MGKAFGYADTETDAAAEEFYEVIHRCRCAGIPLAKIVRGALGEIYSLSEEVEVPQEPKG